MPNTHINKVVFGGRTLLDLGSDTASAETVLAGQTFHDKSGAAVTGACTFDSDTSEDTAAVAEILSGKTAHARGTKLTGTMPNNGSVKLELQDKDTPVIIPHGYHDGSGNVKINASDAAKLKPENIRQGVEVLGVTGTMTGTEDVKLQAKSATPTVEAQTVLPDEGFDGMTQVSIAGIPYVESDNPAGGKTATIG